MHVFKQVRMVWIIKAAPRAAKKPCTNSTQPWPDTFSTILTTLSPTLSLSLYCVPVVPHVTENLVVSFIIYTTLMKSINMRNMTGLGDTLG